jgi:two-component system OmpR family sensor kinase
VSLRARLLVVALALIVTYAVAAYAVVSTQRSLLIDQIDRRLAALPPDVLTGQVVAPPPGQAPVVRPMEQDVSPFFVAVVDAERNVTPLVAGGLVPGTPDIARAVAATGGDPGAVTIAGVDASTRFRAVVAPQPDTGVWVVAAESLAETDATIARLRRTLWITGAIVVAVLGIAMFWVQRLGLRPIARVTAAAEAIAAGDRTHRVGVRDDRTEAGKLGRSFNLMLDELALSEARLRQFVADASHELRTPLTSVRGYLELFQQGAFREPGQLDDVVRRLSAESTRMHGLVEDLLALASLDEGRPFQAEPVDVGQLLGDAAQDAQAVQPERPIATEVTGPGPIVTGDANLLRQLIGALVSNALTHTPRAVPVSLGAARHEADVVVTVADQGPGLDPEAASRAFDRFWRGQSSRTRSGKGGAGLGLTIARSIVDAHGGSIALETAPGRGCTVVVRLPAERDNSSEPEPSHQPAAGQPSMRAARPAVAPHQSDI